MLLQSVAWKKYYLVYLISFYFRFDKSASKHLSIAHLTVIMRPPYELVHVCKYYQFPCFIEYSSGETFASVHVAYNIDAV